MRRKISIALTALLSAGLLAGCAGGSTPTSEPVNQPSENDDTQVVTEDVAEVEETTETEADPDETTPMVGMSRFFDYTGWSTEGSADWIALYEDFIAGSGTVSVGSETRHLTEGEYTLAELVENMQTDLENYGLPTTLSEIDYALIDCGKDGFPELALKLPFEDENGYQDASTDYVIIRPFQGTLSVVTVEETYYRTETSINEYGYINYGGSGGATQYYSENKVVTADGELYSLYSETTYFGIGSLAFSPDVIYGDLASAVVPGDFEFGDKYEIHAYNFGYESAFDPSTQPEEYSADLAKNRVYVFTDNDGNDAMPDEAYIRLCADNGISIVSSEDIKTMIGERCALYGATEDILAGEEPDWDPLTAS